MTAFAQWRGLSLWPAIAVFIAALSGCVTPPESTPGEPVAPSPVDAPSPPESQATPGSPLEARHYEHALAYGRDGNWADALVHWELLALLRPESAEYRDAIAETRKRIRETADSLLRAAELARKQANWDQAVLLYLRVLNVDRDNTTAARALRDIEAERTLRSFSHRPPRRTM